MIDRALFAGRTLILTVSLGLLLALPAGAEKIEMANGSKLEGTVQSLTDTQVTLKLASGATLTMPLDKLAPSSVYRLRLGRLDRKDAAGHVALGDYCLQKGLSPQARAMYRKAGRLDPAMAAQLARKLSAVDEQEAKGLYELAQNAFANKLHTRALEQLKKIVALYPTTSYAARARALSQQVLAAMQQPKKLMPAGKAGAKPPAGAPQAKNTPKQKKTAKPAGPQPIDPAKLTGSLRRLYDHVSKLEKAGDQHNALGLKADGVGNVSRARKNYEQALAYYDNAARSMRSVKRLTKAPEVIALFNKIFDALRRKSVNTLMNAAHTMASERNWRRAAHYTDLALRLDPANRTALKLKQKIEENRIVRKASKVTNTKPIVHGR